MSFCSNFGAVCLLAGTALPAWAAGPPAHKVASVVRPNPQTGRLVRAVTFSVRAAAPAHVDLGSMIEEAARRYQVDPLLVHSVIQAESNYDPFAVSSKGARGLMQLMPGTARRFAVRNSFDPNANVDGGVRYLRYLLDLFGDEKQLALAAYNAGEGAVFKYNGIPPYPETAQYVSRVGKNLGEQRPVATGQPPQAAAAPAHPALEQFVDSQGTLHIRTRPAP